MLLLLIFLLFLSLHIWIINPSEKRKNDDARKNQLCGKKITTQIKRVRRNLNEFAGGGDGGGGGGKEVGEERRK